MADGINVNFDYTELEANLVRLQTVYWERIAARIYSKMVRLINQGKNSSGQKFADYTPQYKAWKIKKGYSGQVNLQLTSQMVLSLNFRATQGRFEIFLNGELNNKKMLRIHELNNWQVMTWGKELLKALDLALQEMFRDAGFI